MKKEFLLTTALLCGASMVAQVDLTPDRFNFANQEEGEFLINYWRETANPVNGFQTAYDEADNGFLLVAAAAGNVTEGTVAATDMAATIQKYTNIIDLGGTVGKVLCLKGPSSTYQYGPDADGQWEGWFNYNFYVRVTGCEAPCTIRTRLVFSIVGNDQEAYDDVFSMYGSTWSNTASTAISGYFAPDRFLMEDPDYPGETYYDEDGYAVYDETKWMIYEFDHEIGETTGIPTRLKMEIKNTYFAEACILIKELSFTMNPTGDPVEAEYVTYTPGSSSSVKDMVIEESETFEVAGNEVTFYAAGSVYGISGIKVGNAVAGETVTLDRGIYVVKAGNKVQKMIVK